MTNNELAPNASLAEVNLEACNTLEADARAMLARAWDNPGHLGEASEIGIEAALLFAKIKQHSSPRDDDEEDTRRKIFLNALRLSWLAVWRARDYSLNRWQAEAKSKGWSVAHYPTTNGYCEVYGGVRWSPIHFPIFGRDGEPLSRANSSLPSQWISNIHEALMEGAMLRDNAPLTGLSLEHLPWSMIGTEPGAIIRGRARHLDNTFWLSEAASIAFENQNAPSLRGAIFLGDANFHTFKNDNLKFIADARFEGGLRLTGAKFSTTIVWPHIETGPRLHFSNSLSTGLRLDSRRGVKLLQIDGSNTGSVHVVADNGLNIELGDNSILAFQAFKASGQSLGSFTAHNAQFKQAVEFADTTFSGDVVLQNCTFPRAIFSGSVMSRRASFLNCTFFDKADFSGATFGSSARFQGASFEEVTFSGTEFGGLADFYGVGFSARARFDLLRSDQIAPKPTIFRQTADFRGSRQRPEAGAFDFISFLYAQFQGPVLFRNRKFENDTLFDGAEFLEPPSFHGAAFHPRTSFDGVEFKWHRKRKADWFARMITGRLASWLRRPVPEAVERENLYLSEVADSFRVATSLAKRIDAPDLAFRFHREELHARSRTSVGGSIGRPEAWAGFGYGILGNFGNSFIRPLALWFAILFASAWFYNSAAPDKSDRLDAALTVSLAAQTRPFVFLDSNFGKIADYASGGAWPSAHEPTGDRNVDPCRDQGDGVGKVTFQCLSSHLIAYHDREFKLVAVFQSIASIVLLFLAALGLRRKFQTA